MSNFYTAMAVYPANNFLFKNGQNFKYSLKRPWSLMRGNRVLLFYISKYRYQITNFESMILQWIGFFVPKKPIHRKLIDLTILLTDKFFSNLLILATLKIVKNSLFHNEIWRQFLTVLTSTSRILSHIPVSP